MAKFFDMYWSDPDGDTQGYEGATKYQVDASGALVIYGPNTTVENFGVLILAPGDWHDVTISLREEEE